MKLIHRVITGDDGQLNHIINLIDEQKQHDLSTLTGYGKTKEDASRDLEKKLEWLTDELESILNLFRLGVYETVSHEEMRVVREKAEMFSDLMKKKFSRIVDGKLSGNRSNMEVKYTDITEFDNNSMYSPQTFTTEKGADKPPLKIFLSHQMSGLSEDDVSRIRNDATQKLTDRFGQIEIIDNYHHEDVPSDAGRLWHLGTSIRQMEKADGVYFCDGWESAKGCQIEKMICDTYGILILNEG